MATQSTSTNETLTLEQKANRELASSLLDARRNLTTTSTEAETKLAASRDQAIKDFSKATTADQVVVRAKSLAVTVEQYDKDRAALKQVKKLIDERLKQLEADSPADVKAVCKERIEKLKEQISKSESDKKPLEDELKLLAEIVAEPKKSKDKKAPKKTGGAEKTPTEDRGKAEA